jgi:predicted DsbA family dithiol-disulfide isomerase
MDVDVWSDIACPWCYVGKRRLERAIADYDGPEPIKVRWHSFQLDPVALAAPEGDMATLIARKYGVPLERATAMLEETRELAAGEGIELHFELARAANTFDAHRLVQLALVHGLQGEMKERLMRAYFTDGALVSDHATLRGLALEVGLPADEVDALLAGEALADEVRTDE